MSIQHVRSSTLEWRPLDEPGVSGIAVKVLRYDQQARCAPTGCVLMLVVPEEVVILTKDTAPATLS